MKYIAAFAATAALATAVPAASQDQAPQLSEATVAAMVRVALPRALQSVQQRCTGTLASNAYMYRQSNVLMSRFQASAAQSWPEARQAVIQMAANNNAQVAAMLGNLPPEVLQPMVDELVAGMVTSKLEVAQCGKVDQVMEMLDPLPAENLSRLLGFMVVESQNGSASPFGLNIGPSQ